MYALGSGLTTSILNAYFVKPVEKDKGKDVATMFNNYQKDQRLLVTAAGKIAGNIFAGKDILDGFALTRERMFDVWHYMACFDNMLYEGIEFEASSTTLGNVFNALFNVNFSGAMHNIGDDMNGCYSAIRSLFVKNG